MKLLNIDWSEMLKFSRFWKELEFPVKEKFLFGTQPVTVPVETIDPGVFSEFEKHGYLKVSSTGKNATFSAAARHYHRIYHALTAAWDVEPSDQGLLISVLRTFYSRPERMAMTRRNRFGRWTELDLAMQVGTVLWPALFLKCRSASEWEVGHDCVSKEIQDLERMNEVFLCARMILRSLIQSGASVRIDSLCALAPDHDEGLVMEALNYLLENMLVFFESTMSYELSVSVWCFVQWFMEVGRDDFPPEVEAEVITSPDFMTGDITRLMVEVSSGSLNTSLRTGYFSRKDQKRLEGLLDDLPENVLLPVVYTKTFRLVRARNEALIMKLFEYQEHEKSISLVLTETGQKWLGSSTDMRRKFLLCQLRPSEEDLEENCYNSDVWGEGQGLLFSIPTLHERSALHRLPPDLSPSLYKAFQGLCDMQNPVSLTLYLKYQSENNNPYRLLFHAGVPAIEDTCPFQYVVDDSEMDSLWKKELEQFFWKVMVPLGMISTAGDGSEIMFKLTDAGRYFLGGSTEPDLGKAESSGVVVQQDLRILFPSPNPAAEGLLGRFCEKTGFLDGHLLKLSARGVYRGVRSGLDASDMLEMLDETSAEPVPASVRSQIQAWVSECRIISAETRVLIRCPDAETASRIVEIAGKKTEQLSPTVLSVSNRKVLKKLAALLTNSGIFLEE